MDTPFSTAPATIPRSVDRSAMYPPSWVDCLTAWIDARPGPSWAFYAGLWLVLFLTVTVIKWWDGAYAPGTFFPGHACMTALTIYSLAVMHYLDRLAAASLRDIRPALTISEAEYATLAYQLTTMPRRLAWLASGFGVILFWLRLPLLVHSLAPLSLFTSPLSVVTDTLFLSFTWAVVDVVIYHTIHQLRIVRTVYAKYARISLFETGPLYALSKLTAFSSVAITLGSQAWLNIAPGVSARPVERGVTLLLTLLAVVMFVWPLLALHRRLVQEKTRQQADVARELEAIFAELRRSVHEKEFKDMDGLNKAAAMLAIEENRLDKVPTWPWRPETLRLVATAVLLPIVLWTMQHTLGRFLGL